MKPSDRNRMLLVMSHLLAGLLGAICGYAYDYRRGPLVDTIIEGMTDLPQSDAAAIAYRFGTAQHAHSLLLALPVPDTQDQSQLAGILFRYLRVTAVCNELGDLSCESKYLALATQICDRRYRKHCTPDKMTKALEIAKKPRFH